VESPIDQTSPHENVTLDYDEVWLDLIGGKTSAQVADDLLADGHEAGEVNRLIEELRSRPAFRESLRLANRNRKLNGLLHAFGELFTRSDFAIERIRMTGEEFYRRYFFNNRPVIVQALMEDWPARSLWSPGYFRERYGEVEIEVVDNRDDKPYEEFDSRRKAMTVGEFVERIDKGERSEKLYLIARNRVLRTPGLDPLWADFSFPETFLKGAGAETDVRFWFGPRGTVTTSR
jgi:hypothetical protein